MINENHLKLLESTQYFDEAWYLHRYKDVKIVGISAAEHYLRIGYLLGRDPSLKFSTSFYFKAHPDVAALKINPLIHYLEYGVNEARIISPVQIAETTSGQNLRTTKTKTPARVAIYTALTGGHDVLVDPECVPQHCDFFVFTNAEVSTKVWKKRPINFYCDDKTKVARFIKLHPHLFFPDYEYSIWIDANIQLTQDITHLLEGLNNIISIGCFPHPYRSGIYEEAEACIEREKDNPEIIQLQVERYKSLGVPEVTGMWETGILARRHNEKASIDLMTAWWSEVQLYSRRDQISLPAISFLQDIKIKLLAPIGADLRMYPGVMLRKHNPLSKRNEDDTRQAVAVMWRDIDTQSIPVDIVVCVYNALDETRECLDSLLRSMRPKDKLIIVNDASNEETRSFLNEFASIHTDVKLITNPENKGYTKSANIGLKSSSNPYVMLLNSDTQIYPGVLDKMILLAEQNKHIGIIGPLSNAAVWQSIPWMAENNDYSRNNLLSDLGGEKVNQLLEDNFTGVIPYVDLINGFCYLIKRDVINTIGYLDEAAFPVGYGEEDDFSLRARKAGFILAIATNAYIYHHKSKSFTSERRLPLAKAGHEALIGKHGKTQLTASVKTLANNLELAHIRNVMSGLLQKEY